ncbi:MAG: cysteine-rich CWC family protein [Pseudomonadales bacterium]|nr:cysteine-rich CWC family protein [Pseudomonadales bacterium]
MIKSKNPCWCKNVVVPDKLSDMVPVELMRKSCICQECIKLFNKNPSRFISKYS